METLFDLCSFRIEPVDKEAYLSALRQILKSDIPATITTKDIEIINELNEKLSRDQALDQGDGEADGESLEDSEAQPAPTGTSPLHRIVESLEVDSTEDRVDLALDMIDILFQYGGSWMMLDDNNDTPGCIALKRRVDRRVYDQFVRAGVRSEVFLRKMTEPARGDDEDDEGEGSESNEGQDGANEGNGIEREKSVSKSATSGADTAIDKAAYLEADLEYSDHNLITKDQKDGVMMDWEAPIMKRSAEILTQSGGAVLNVGFGMGIIDSYIQESNPKHHYISEAHPAVLAKMRRDGWFDKPGVTVLEGRWQDTLPKLLDAGVYMDGIYYDTFSEQYDDMIEFYDNVVGLLSPQGTFSYFNGLGADRQVCYDVYCQVVDLDLQEYGLQLEFETLPIGKDVGATNDPSGWDSLKMKYWTLDEYKLPKVKFLDL